MGIGTYVKKSVVGAGKATYWLSKQTLRGMGHLFSGAAQATAYAAQNPRRSTRALMAALMIYCVGRGTIRARKMEGSGPGTYVHETVKAAGDVVKAPIRISKDLVDLVTGVMSEDAVQGDDYDKVVEDVKKALEDPKYADEVAEVEKAIKDLSEPKKKTLREKVFGGAISGYDKIRSKLEKE